MKPVGIHTDFRNSLPPFPTRYERILRHNGIPAKRLFCGGPEFWQTLPELSAFIFRWEHYSQDHQLAHTLMPLIEHDLKVPLFPNHATAWHFDDKIRQYYLMKRHHQPMTECWIFWNHAETTKFIEQAIYPIVFKLKSGAGSTNVALVENMAQARNLVDAMFSRGIFSGKIPLTGGLQTKFFSLKKRFRSMGSSMLRRQTHRPPVFWSKEYGYALFQKYLPGNDFDTRITVIGDRAYGFRRFNRPSDFRSSGSGRIDYDRSQISKACIELAFAVSKLFKFQSMAYDFLFNEDKKPEFVEFSYSFNDESVYGCDGYWDAQLEWHPGHFYPQYFQLIDLLQRPDLKQPDGPF